MIRNGESSSEEPKYVSQPPIMHIVAYCTVCNCPHGTSDLPNLGVQQDQVEQPVAGSRTHPARGKNTLIKHQHLTEILGKKRRQAKELRKTYKFVQREIPRKLYMHETVKLLKSFYICTIGDTRASTENISAILIKCLMSDE